MNQRIFAALAAFSLAAIPSVAQSAPDTTPPTLRTPIKSSWVVGNQLSLDSLPDCGSYETGDGVTWVNTYQTFSWRGTDSSGPLSYSVVENTKGEGPNDPVDLGTQTSYSPWTTNANQGCGGGSWMPSNWDVTATDPAGNATTNNVRGGLFTVTQDSNLADDSGYATRPTIAYGGGWTLAHCACWSDGGVHKTKTAGASATVNVDIASDREGPVTHLGIVMHRGPDRGRFKVLVDGVLNKTVDLYAATSTPRTIVWQASLDDIATHKVKIVNLATAGRPRIDLDAIVTN